MTAISKWCAWCKSDTHNNADCWSTRPVNWNPTAQSVPAIIIPGKTAEQSRADQPLRPDWRSGQMTDTESTATQESGKEPGPTMGDTPASAADPNALYAEIGRLREQLKAANDKVVEYYEEAFKATNALEVERTAREEAEQKVLRVVRGEFSQLCSYCGWEAPANGAQWDELQAHIKTCEKHPLRGVEQELAAERTACLQAEHERDGLREQCIGERRAREKRELERQLAAAQKDSVLFTAFLNFTGIARRHMVFDDPSADVLRSRIDAAITKEKQ